MGRKGWNLLWWLAGLGGAVFLCACLLVAGAFALLLAFGEVSAEPGTSSNTGTVLSTPAPRRPSPSTPFAGAPFPTNLPPQDEPVDEGAFWASLPRPPDETPLPVTEGVDMAYGTALSPDQVLNMYAAWLKERGWQPVPPEAVPGLALPQDATVQVWKKGDTFFAVVARRQEDAQGTRVELVLRRE